MPLPIFLLEFLDKHGRNPRPDELTRNERRILLRCCVENIERDASIESGIASIDEYIEQLKQQRQALVDLKPDTDRWHDLIEACVGVSPVQDPEENKSDGTDR